MIEAKQLTRHFAGKTVLNNLCFQVKQGEVLGLLGPNGAGKTTTLKLLTCFLPHTAGSATILGFDTCTHPRQVQRCIGYLPEGSPFYSDMTVGGFLTFIAAVRNYRGANKRSRIARVIEGLDLSSVYKQPIETLSKGFKRRVGLAQAVLHDPQVLILDEPTDGLEPKAGCQVAYGTPLELASQSRLHNAVHLYPAHALDLLALALLPGVASVEPTPGRPGAITLLAKPGVVIFPVVSQLVTARQWPVKRMHCEPECFAAVYRHLMDETPQ